MPSTTLSRAHSPFWLRAPAPAQLTALGLSASGGEAHTAVVADNTSALVGNSLRAPVAASVDHQPLVATLLEMLMGMAFHEPGFDLAAHLNDLQAEVCALISRMDANGTIAEGNLALSNAASAQVCWWGPSMRHLRACCCMHASSPARRKSHAPSTHSPPALPA